MIFIILSIILVLVFITQIRYNTIWKVLVINALMIAVTTGFMLWGLTVTTNSDYLQIFTATMRYRDFMHLIIVWYGGDILCLVLSCKKYRAYLEVNRKVPKL